MPVARDRKPAPVLITDAPENPEREQRRREIRYVIMMSIRAACLIAGAIIVSAKPPLWGLWLSLTVAGMVVLPWLAVIMANDRRPRRPGSIPTPTSTQAALPAPRDDRVIDDRVIDG
jgi:Flp pilus assembly protein TadB